MLDKSSVSDAKEGSFPKSVIAHKRFCSKELWSGGLRSCSRKIGKRAVPKHRELCELSVAGRVAVRAVFNRWVTGGSSGRSCHPAAECPKPFSEGRQDDQVVIPLCRRRKHRAPKTFTKTTRARNCEDLQGLRRHYTFRIGTLFDKVDWNRRSMVTGIHIRRLRSRAAITAAAPDSVGRSESNECCAEADKCRMASNINVR